MSNSALSRETTGWGFRRRGVEDVERIEASKDGIERDGGEEGPHDAGDHGSSGIAKWTMDDSGPISGTSISVSKRMAIPAVTACSAKLLELFSVRTTMANIAPIGAIYGIASGYLRNQHGFRWLYGLHWSFYA